VKKVALEGKSAIYGGGRLAPSFAFSGEDSLLQVKRFRWDGLDFKGIVGLSLQCCWGRARASRSGPPRSIVRIEPTKLSLGHGWLPSRARFRFTRMWILPAPAIFGSGQEELASVVWASGF